MPETFTEKMNRILRDHEGYTGDGQGNVGDLPIGDRSTSRKPINKRDLREIFSELSAFEFEAELENYATTEDLDALAAVTVSGVTRKEAVACATTANISLSGEQTIDGVTTSASRVLVKNQSTAAQNGIYVSASGAWTRAADMDAAGEVQGAAVFVNGGTANAGKTFYTGSEVTTLGTDAIAWVVSEDTSALYFQSGGLAGFTLPANEFPNYNTTSNVFTIPAGTDLVHGLKSATLPATSVTLPTSSTSIKVYYTFSTGVVSALPYNDLPPANATLIATIRRAGLATTMGISVPYTINGGGIFNLPARIFEPAMDSGLTAMVPPSVNATPTTPSSRRLPAFKTIGEFTLTIPAGTIMVWQNKRVELPADAVINLGTAGSSIQKVFYNFTTGEFTNYMFYTVEPKGLALVALVRRNSNTQSNSDNTLVISCQYTVNGMSPDGVPPSGNPLVKAVAHRGYRGAPENTLASYRLAKRMGYNYTETDLRLTSDNEIVLIHDETVDRTSDGTGLISGMTLAEAKLLDFGSYVDAKYAGERIPTLAEHLTLHKKLGMHPYLEIKYDEAWVQARIDDLVDTVRKAGMINDVTYICSGWALLDRVLIANPKARVALLGNLSSIYISNAVAKMTSENTVFANVEKTSATEPLIEEALLAGLPVEVYTANDSTTIISRVNWGASGFTTDYANPAEILRLSEIT